MLDQDSARALMVIADDQPRPGRPGRGPPPAARRWDAAGSWTRRPLGATRCLPDPGGRAPVRRPDLRPAQPCPCAPGHPRALAWCSTPCSPETRSVIYPPSRAHPGSGSDRRSRHRNPRDRQERAWGGCCWWPTPANRSPTSTRHIRERLVAGGHVDGYRGGHDLGGRTDRVGDQVATRRNDRDADVANRDTWTVTAPHRRRAGCCREPRPAGPARRLRAATTSSSPTPAPSMAPRAPPPAPRTCSSGNAPAPAGAYIAMTRGRHHNTAHWSPTTPQEARDQWIEIFNRDRADLGPAHAARLRSPGSRPLRHPPPPWRGPVRPVGTPGPKNTPWPSTSSAARARARPGWPRSSPCAPTRTPRSPPGARSTSRHAATPPRRANTPTRLEAARRRRHLPACRPAAPGVGHRPPRSKSSRTDHRLQAPAGSGNTAAPSDAPATTSRRGPSSGARSWHPCRPTPTSLAVLAAGHDDPNLGQAITAYARALAEDAHPDHAPAQARGPRRRARQQPKPWTPTKGSHQLPRRTRLATATSPGCPIPPATSPRPNWTSPSSPSSYAPLRVGSAQRWPNHAIRSLRPKSASRPNAERWATRTPRAATGRARGQCRPRRRTLPDKRAPARTIRGVLLAQARARDRPLSRRPRLRNDSRRS